MRLLLLICCVFVLVGCGEGETDLAAFLFGPSGIGALDVNGNGNGSGSNGGGNGGDGNGNPVIPEPATVFLLGSGLVVAYLRKHYS